MYVGLLRLHHQYAAEYDALEVGALAATEAPIMRRHVVIVLVDRLDLAAARAIQYARTLTPDDLRAVHIDIDSKAAHLLEEEWGRLGLARLPLDIIECPDRRLGRAAVELVADAVADGDTECTVLLPRRGFASGWQRFLHDRTADRIAAVVSQVPHVSATIVPYNLSRLWRQRTRTAGGRAAWPARCWSDVAAGVGPTATGRASARGRARTSEADLALARRASGTDPDRRGPLPRAGAGGRPGALGPGPAPGRHLQSRVRAERRLGPPAPRVPGSAPHPGRRAGRPHGRLGHGRLVGPEPRHLEPGLRAGGRRPARSHRGTGRLGAHILARTRTQWLSSPRPVPAGAGPRANGGARLGRPAAATGVRPLWSCTSLKPTEGNATHGSHDAPRHGGLPGLPPGRW